MSEATADELPEPDVRSVFARAAARIPPPVPAAGRFPSRDAADGSAPSVTVRTCRRCGAAREADTVYGRCAFCGTDFFPQHG